MEKINLSIDLWRSLKNMDANNRRKKIFYSNNAICLKSLNVGMDM